MDNALKGPDAFNWSRCWGLPFWSGRGRTLPTGVLTWSWSVLSPAEDRTWSDTAGNAHEVGADKVSQPRGQFGVVEVPRAVLAHLADQPAAIRAFITTGLKAKRFTDVSLAVTRSALTVDELHWRLTR